MANSGQDGTLNDRVFTAGLRRFVSAPLAIWEAHGAPEVWGWDWRLVEGPPGSASSTQGGYPYCVLQVTRAARSGHLDQGQEHEQPDVEAAAAAEKEEQYTEPHDDACLAPGPSAPPVSASVHWEFHVVYSEVFGVPSLWLTAAGPDGQPLTEAEVACALPIPPDVAFAHDPHLYLSLPLQKGKDGGSRQVVERWTMLSQDEHPALGRPFCCLHPCGTAARMRLLLSGGPGLHGGICDPDVDGLGYLIKWFGLVAPVVGLPYPAAFVQRVLGGAGVKGVEID